MIVNFNGEDHQIGITSFGCPLCGVGYPAVFTSTRYYLDWIHSSMKKLEAN